MSLLSAPARRVPATMLRAARLTRSLGTPFSWFERDDGRRVELLTGVRDAVRPSWRGYWWPTRLLLTLRARVDLPEELDSLASDLEQARTLPATLDDLAKAVQPLVEMFPDHVHRSGVVDVRTGLPVLEARLHGNEPAARAATYRAHAEAVREAVATCGVDWAGARVLDAGTGSGYLAFALAGLGADVVGVDLDLASVSESERETMRELLAHRGNVRLERADVHDLPYEDATFDVVCSLTAVEHFADARRALKELSRVVRPGGAVYHVVDPWYGKRGGHSLCTLDFPWGHARLSPGELQRYLTLLRPNEAADAVVTATTAFQRPPLSLVELRDAFEAAHSRIVSMEIVDLPWRDPHRAALTRSILADCRSTNSSVTQADLLTLTVTITARVDRAT